MFMVNCYSVEMSYSTHLELSDEEIRVKCAFEYGIQVTEEMYIAIQPRRLHIIPVGYTDGVETVKAFYFGKEIVRDNNED